MLVAGQYIRVPFDTPHYRGFHNLASRNWSSNNDEPEATLGESIDATQHWTPGGPLADLPLPRLVGDRECVASGDTYNPAASPPLLQLGFVAGCWNNAVAPFPDRVASFDLVSKASQLQLATILNLLYTDEAAATAAAIAMLGPGTVVTVGGSNSGSLYPKTLIATNGSVTVVFATGTDNYLQASAQAMFSLAPAANFSGWGTNLAWLSAATVIDGRIAAAGIPPTSEILLVGHSYGAAALANLAALKIRANPGSPLALLTFGMPKPGDQRLINILRSVPQVNIVNGGDPIPSMPPYTYDLWPLWLTVPSSIIEAWGAYAQPEGRYVLDEEGEFEASMRATFSLLDLGTLVTDALTSTPLTAIVDHSMDEYLLRVTQRPD